MPNPRSAYSDGLDFFGSVSPAYLAEKYGTPLYVYNENILRRRCRELRALSDDPGFCVNYSVKANSNPALLRIIREEGLSADAMSPGELRMDVLAGYDPRDVLYISNNNTREEMLEAIAAGCVVSLDSLVQLDVFGSLKPGNSVLVRVNPGVGDGHDVRVITGGAHSKFGVDPGKLDELAAILARWNLALVGLNQHIGSLFMKPDKYLAACAVLLRIAENLPKTLFADLRILDFGGGFGIPYHKYENEARLDMEALGLELRSITSSWRRKTGYAGRFLVEPGRYVVAECGLVLGRVTSVKETSAHVFVGTDVGFNVLQRPAFYGSFHDLEIYGAGEREGEIEQTIVGNICESGDIVAGDRLLPRARVGDLIGVLDAGAYGFSMASNYNERLLPAEVLITANGRDKLIRRRQTLADLETCLTGLD